LSYFVAVGAGVAVVAGVVAGFVECFFTCFFATGAGAVVELADGAAAGACAAKDMPAAASVSANPMMAVLMVFIFFSPVFRQAARLSTSDLCFAFVMIDAGDY
jgi:hypothetical protein